MEIAPAAVYEPRNPRDSSLFALVEDYYEEFERVYDERYQQQYGPWRPVIISLIENSSVIEKILRHLKLWDLPERPPSPRAPTTLGYDADFLAWQAAGRLFDGID